MCHTMFTHHNLAIRIKFFFRGEDQENSEGGEETSHGDISDRTTGDPRRESLPYRLEYNSPKHFIRGASKDRRLSTFPRFFNRFNKLP